MDKEDLELLREWVKAEIDAAIADHEPGSDGYFGTGYGQRKEAERLFIQIVDKFQETCSHVPLRVCAEGA